MKFSIIVPIYNTEKYLQKCLESIQKQSYSNFEVLMIDDGSTDNSKDIMKIFEDDERFISYHKENGGLSDTRNYGIEIASGDYLLFIDSDDEIEKDLLYNLNSEIEKNKVDLIKFQIKVVGIETKIEKSEIFSSISGEEAFKKLYINGYFVSPCCYAYRRDFFIENKFYYTKGRYHEDFGLIPIVIVSAKSVTSIEYVGYNYYVRPNSIMTNSSNNLKKAEDTLYFFKELVNKINSIDVTEETRKLFKSYCANALLCKSKTLKGENQKKFLKELKNIKLESYMLNDTLVRKIKKLLLKLSYPFYVKIFIKEK